jgi:hypothetical protein
MDKNGFIVFDQTCNVKELIKNDHSTCAHHYEHITNNLWKLIKKTMIFCLDMLLIYLFYFIFSIMWFSSWPLWSINSPWYGSLSNEDIENFIPLSWHNLLIKIL